MCYPVQRRCMRLTGHIGFYVSQLEERGNFVQVELVRLFLVADGVHEDFERLGTVLKTCRAKKTTKSGIHQSPCVMNPMGIHISA